VAPAGRAYANSASELHRLADCLGVHFVGRSRPARPQSSACDGRFSGLPVGSRPDRANPASMGGLLGGRPPEICGELDGQSRPPTGGVVRGRGQQCAFQWPQRQERRHRHGSRSPPRRITARALFLRSRGRLLSCDGFSPCGQDDSSSPTIHVAPSESAFVDEDFARYYWPHASPIGQRLWDGSEAGKDAEAFTVVGVVGEVKQAGLTEDEAQGAIYYPYAFRIGDSVFVAVRTSVPPESLGFDAAKGWFGKSTPTYPSMTSDRWKLALPIALSPVVHRRCWLASSLG